MSKGPWKRCPVSGITLVKLQGTDHLSNRGEFKASEFPDCDLFADRTIASTAGFGRVDHWKDRALAPGSSYFHLHRIEDDEGRVLGYATAQNSAEQGGINYRCAAKDRQLSGKRASWDVTSGTVPQNGAAAQLAEPLVQAGE